MKLKLSEDLSLPLEAVSRTFGILAVRGAGKSNTAAVMAEEMFKAGLPFVVVDPVGSWFGLRSSADGKSAGLSIPIFGGKHGDLPLERGAGELLADLVVERRLSCVLDLSQFESESAKKEFLLAFARRLYLKNEDPLHLFLEEADDYIPQKPMRDEAQLLRAWENIVRRGRARGLGITLITQRSASLAKMVLTQVETLFAMRTTGPQDIAAIAEWVKYHQVGHEVLSSLASLEDGEAWVWSPHFLKVMKRVQIRRRHTFDSGATPKNVKTGERRPAATLADVDLDALRTKLAATIEKAKADDPRELRKQIQAQHAELANLRKSLSRPECLTTAKTVEKFVLTDTDRALLKALAERLATRVDAIADRADLMLNSIAERAKAAVAETAAEWVKEVAAHRGEFDRLLDQKGFQKILGKLAAIQPHPDTHATMTPRVDRQGPVSSPGRGAVPAATVRRPAPRVSLASSNGDGDVSPARQKVLNALAFLHGIGIRSADKTQLALLTGVSPTSGGYFNNLGALRSSGFIDYPSGGTVALTAAGERIASTDGVPTTTEELHAAIQAKLSPAKWRILVPLIRAYPHTIAKDALAEQIGVSPTSGGYFNNLGSLRSLGLITYPHPGTAAAQPVLFLEER